MSDRCWSDAVTAWQLLLISGSQVRSQDVLSWSPLRSTPSPCLPRAARHGASYLATLVSPRDVDYVIEQLDGVTVAGWALRVERRP